MCVCLYVRVCVSVCEVGRRTAAFSPDDREHSTNKRRWERGASADFRSAKKVAVLRSRIRHVPSLPQTLTPSDTQIGNLKPQSPKMTLPRNTEFHSGASRPCPSPSCFPLLCYRTSASLVSLSLSCPPSLSLPAPFLPAPPPLSLPPCPSPSLSLPPSASPSTFPPPPISPLKLPASQRTSPCFRAV